MLRLILTRTCALLSGSLEVNTYILRVSGGKRVGTAMALPLLFPEDTFCRCLFRGAEMLRGKEKLMRTHTEESAEGVGT